MSSVTPGDPLHSVDRRLITVDMLGLLFVSGVAVMAPGVRDMEESSPGPPAVPSR